MKTVSVNVLGIIENEHNNAVKTKPLNRFSCEGIPFDDEFEDAVSHDVSRIERKNLPVLRVPKVKKSV